MSDDEKKPFIDQSNEDQKRYKREMTAYLKNHPKRAAGPESPGKKALRGCTIVVPKKMPKFPPFVFCCLMFCYIVLYIFPICGMQH